MPKVLLPSSLLSFCAVTFLSIERVRWSTRAALVVTPKHLAAPAVLLYCATMYFGCTCSIVHAYFYCTAMRATILSLARLRLRTHISCPVSPAVRKFSSFARFRLCTHTVLHCRGRDQPDVTKSKLKRSPISLPLQPCQAQDGGLIRGVALAPGWRYVNNTADKICRPVATKPLWDCTRKDWLKRVMVVGTG